MQGSPLYEYSRKTVGKSQDGGEPKLEHLKLANFFWCGDRNRIRTVKPMHIGINLSYLPDKGTQ